MSNKKKILTKLRDLVNESLSNELEAESKHELVEAIGVMPMTMIMDTFEELVPFISESHEHNKILRLYVRTIKENKDLTKLFNTITCLRKPVDVSDVQTYVNEALNIIDKCDKKSLKEGVEKLNHIVKEGLLDTVIKSDCINEVFNNSRNNKFNKAFNFIFEHKCTTGNLTKWSYNKSLLYESVSDAVKQNNSEESMSYSDAMEKVKGFVSEATEDWQKAVYNDVVEAEITGGESKKALFEKYKIDCISMLDEAIENYSDDAGSVARLTEMKQKLSAKMFNEGKYYTDMEKMGELKNICSIFAYHKDQIGSLGDM